jgi:hypothetical protein
MKIIVRHAMGAGGWFICGLIYSMLKPVTHSITEGASGHNLGFIFESHNYDDLINIDPRAYLYYSEEEYNNGRTDLSEAVNWFRNHLAFENDKSHILRTHARNINPLVLAIGVADTRVINIQHSDSELDQMCFNFAFKTILPEDDWIDNRGQDTIDNLHYHYPGKYNHITIDMFKQKRLEKDLKFLTWIVKMSWVRYWTRYGLYTPLPQFNVFDITWAEIADRSLIDKLDNIASFLGITLTDERRGQVAGFINEYADKQIVVPFTITPDDY